MYRKAVFELYLRCAEAGGCTFVHGYKLASTEVYNPCTCAQTATNFGCPVLQLIRLAVTELAHREHHGWGAVEGDSRCVITWSVR